jgi:hypothetical protein
MLYYITTSEEQGKILKQWARKYKEAGVREGLKIFSLQMSEII